MYTFLGVMQFFAYLAIIVAAAVLVWNFWKNGAPRREHLARKVELRKGAPLHSDTDYVEPEVQREQAFKFLGLPTVHPGGHVIGVPIFAPGQAGRWNDNREVLTTARIIGYTRRGPDSTDLVELDGGYMLAVSGGRPFLFVKHTLTQSDEDLLKDNRKRACDRGQPEVFTFEGQNWIIRGAMGDNKNPRPGERKCSSIQVLGTHPHLGEAGFVSMLPPSLMDGKEHDYFDLRARNADGRQVMYAFYCGEKWTCFIGRQLTDEENGQMQGV